VINITQRVVVPRHDLMRTRSTAVSLLPRNGPLPRRAVSTSRTSAGHSRGWAARPRQGRAATGRPT